MQEEKGRKNKEMDLKRVFAKNESEYRLKAKNKHF